MTMRIWLPLVSSSTDLLSMVTRMNGSVEIHWRDYWHWRLEKDLRRMMMSGMMENREKKRESRRMMKSEEKGDDHPPLSSTEWCIRWLKNFRQSWRGSMSHWFPWTRFHRWPHFLELMEHLSGYRDRRGGVTWDEWIDWSEMKNISSVRRDEW